MKKPTLLALETATPACSVALITPSNECYVRFELAERAHTQLILPMVTSVLKEAGLSLKDITHLAVGRGPGSFTGVRIATAVAQGLAYGLDLPIYPISTLAALAYQVAEKADYSMSEETVFAALDARMNEMYGAVFQLKGNEMCKVGEEALYLPADFLDHFSEQSGNVIAIGSGWDAYYPALLQTPEKRFLANRHVHAKQIALLALQQWEADVAGVAAQDLQPVYLRNNVAQKPTIASN